ncbi:MAG: methyltransferase domain-containing protein [Alphaproteobacteria bacterium]
MSAAIPVRPLTACRLCGGRDLAPVLSLPPTPPANAFVGPDKLDAPQPLFPLDLRLCRTCGHVQLGHLVDRSALFADYVYVSGTSPAFVEHFRTYAAGCIERAGLRAGDLVADIGSNDGTFLRFFTDAGMRVLGVDPARAIAEAATANGIETRCAFFDAAMARDLAREYGPARLIAANNVFAHLDDIAGFVEGVGHWLAADGLFVFEVSYLRDVLDQGLFDTIYHEHVDYHALAPLTRFFAAQGMAVVDVMRVPTHGGSLRVVVGHAGAEVSPAVERLLQEEWEAGLATPQRFSAFAAAIEAAGSALRGLLAGIAQEGGRVAGFGAPAKATTLMYRFGLTGKDIPFIVDDSPLKQGLYTPGTHIPVVSADALMRERPDYLLILAWNFAGPIMRNHARFHAAGGRFIVPLPKLEVI